MAWVWFAKTFLSPTPRQAIEWTAPPPFDYASYYHSIACRGVGERKVLANQTQAMVTSCTRSIAAPRLAFCFATLQPIVLPVTALYFGVDAMLKKYLLMYVTGVVEWRRRGPLNCLSGCG
jgi:hypothetical protein